MTTAVILPAAPAVAPATKPPTPPAMDTDAGHDPDRCATLCRSCNSSKSNTTPPLPPVIEERPHMMSSEQFVTLMLRLMVSVAWGVVAWRLMAQPEPSTLDVMRLIVVTFSASLLLPRGPR